MKERHYKGSSASLEEKQKNNIWDSIDDFIDVLSKMQKEEWVWYKNMDCKYVNLRVDMRDGGCLIMNKDGKRISPEKLAYQYKSEVE